MNFTLISTAWQRDRAAYTLILNIHYCLYRIKQRRYVEDEEALANSGAFTLSNPLVTVKDEGMQGARKLVCV